MEIHDFVAGVAVLIGLAGIVVVLIPGLALQVAAVAIWAFEESTPLGWAVLAVVVTLAVTATVLKYLFPGRRLKDQGVPGWVLLTAVAGGIVGFFAVPVIGAPLGFVLAVYGFEWARRGKEQAWPSTKTAVKAMLASVGIELAGGFLILAVFAVAVFLT